MTITVTDQRSEPTCNRNFRAELEDERGFVVGLGYGISEVVAINRAWEDCLDTLRSEFRAAMRQFEAQEAQ